jgi:hypothetical protein
MFLSSVDYSAHCIPITEYIKRKQEREHFFEVVSPQARWMTGSAVRMDGGEIKGV